MDEKTIITRRDIDAMADEELLPFVRKHHRMLGERFSSHSFYSPRILDEPYFFRRLCRLDMEQFARLTQEQNQREYFAGGWWAAVLLSQGGTLPEDVLQKQERVMPGVLAKPDAVEADCPLDSALFLEVSEKARKLWAGQPALYQRRMTQCRQLSKALALREKWLDASHTASAAALYRLGWKPLDVMLAYLAGEVFSHDGAVDPDCAADAARRDPETAVRLLDPDHYRAYFQGQCHPSYDMEMAKSWTELLYFHAGWKDLSALEKGHRLKRMHVFYRQTLEHLQAPRWTWQSFEEDLRKTGLLPSDAPLDWDSPKLAKRQRLALTQALVRHYQWRAQDLPAALSASGNPPLFTSLAWGLYQDGRLTDVFTLDEEGAAWGEDGQPAALPDEGQIALVSPAELDKRRLTLWKKRLKAAGGRPPIRQLSLPALPPDLADLEGARTKHITLYSAAGKWGLDMGPLSCHCRADLTDPLHGFGARVWFDSVWDGPEYSGDDVTVLGAAFYRMDPAPFGDYLPRRAIVPPEDLPRRFTAAAGAAFRQLAGLK